MSIRNKNRNSGILGRVLSLAVLAPLALAACHKPEGGSPPAPAPSEVTTAQYVEGLVRIRVTGELAAAIEASTGAATRAFGADNIFDGMGVAEVRRTFACDPRFEGRTRREGLHLWYDVVFDPQHPLTRAGRSLSDVEGVTFVENIPKVTAPVSGRQADAPSPGTTRATAPTFNDEYLPNMWHIYNTGKNGMLAGSDINVAGVWKSYTTGSPDVIVAILDQGVQTDHPDLSANIWTNPGEAGGTAGADNDGNGYAGDLHGFNFLSGSGVFIPETHGTHVAGTVAAMNNNTIGTVGVAGGNGTANTGVRLMICQVIAGPRSAGQDHSGQAFKYAADNGAVIAQCSWNYLSATLPRSTREGLEYFIKYAGRDDEGVQTGPMAGGLVIFSSGNDGDLTVLAPANHPDVFTVAASGTRYNLTHYSCRGTEVDIMAPGGDFQDNPLSGIYSLNMNSGYFIGEGTSCAAPHVSGAAALLVSHYKGAGLTPEMVKKWLRNGATDVTAYNTGLAGQYGAGFLNTLGAFEAAESGSAPAQVTDLAVRQAKNLAMLSWSIPADQDGGVAPMFQIFSSEQPLTGVNLDNPPASVAVTTFATPEKSKAGDRIEYGLPVEKYEQTYYYIVRGRNLAGKVAQPSAVAVLTTAPDSPPALMKEIGDIYVSSLKVQNIVNLAEHFDDANDAVLEYGISLSAPDVIDATITDGRLRIKGLGYGVTQVTVTATDSNGGTASSVFKVLVKDKLWKIDLYPNPVVRHLNVRTGYAAEVRVAIYNAAGVKVHESNVASQPLAPAQIDMSKLPAGQYRVEASTAESKNVQNITKI